MLAVLAVSCYAQQYTISTIAGGGPIHVSAITANAKLPFSVAWDSTGRFYYTAYNRAFRVNTSGVIDLVVGNGIRGASSGDGGPAHLAQLATAEGIAVVVSDEKISRSVHGDIHGRIQFGRRSCAAISWRGRATSGDRCDDAGASGNAPDIEIDTVGDKEISTSVDREPPGRVKAGTGGWSAVSAVAWCA